MEKMRYIIINKITNNISYYYDDIEFGFACDSVLDNTCYKYGFLNIEDYWLNNGKVYVIKERA